MTEGDNIPPHDLEAEQATIGAMIVSPEQIPLISSILPDPSIFWRTSHQHIFRAILQLTEHGYEADWVTIGEQVAVNGALAECGGRDALHDYLAQISQSVPSGYGGTSYARIVRKCGIRRMAILAGLDLARDARNPTVGALQLVRKAEQHAAELDAKLRVGGVLPAAETAIGVIDSYAKTKELLEKSDREVPGISSGFPDIDVYTSGWRPGQLIVIGSRPGQGKTALGLEFSLNAADASERVLFVSTEMTREQLMQRAVCNRGRVDYKGLLQGNLDAAGEAKMEETAEQIGEGKLYLNERLIASAADVVGMIAYAVTTYDIGLVVVDYLQNLQKPRGMKDVEHIANSTKRLKDAALKWDIPVIALAQLSRDVDKFQRRKKGPAPKPRLSHFKGSGEIEQACDVAILLYHPVTRPTLQPVVLIIEKNRDHPTGEIAMDFHKQYSAFEEAEDPDNWVGNYTDKDGELNNEQATEYLAKLTAGGTTKGLKGQRAADW